MFQSKFYTVMIALTFVAAAATVTFQAIELNDYKVFNRIFASK